MSLARAFVLVVVAGVSSAQVPFNDSWQRALPLPSSWSWQNYAHVTTTLGAGQDGVSACDVGPSPDVWYVFTAQSSGVATIFSRGYDYQGIAPVVSVHGLDGDHLIELGCDAGTGIPGTSSQVTWPAFKQRPYYIRLSPRGDPSSPIALRFISNSPDEIRMANGWHETPLSAWPGDYHGYVRSGWGPYSNCLTTGESAWFTYRPQTSGPATVRTDLFTQYNSSIDLLVDGVIVTCAYQYGRGEVLNFEAIAGTEYVIRIGIGKDEAGVYGIRLEGPACAGRTCDDPEPIAEGPSLVSLVGAPVTFLPDGTQADPERYFRYVASGDGLLNVSTCRTATGLVQGYAVDASLSLHAGCPADAGSLLESSGGSFVCADSLRPQPFVSMPVNQGQEVIIRLSARHDGQLWPIALDVELLPHQAFCFGDGSGSACPCGNAGAIHAGCDNSFGTGGARLRATGPALVAQDTLSLVVTDAPPTTTVVLLRAEAGIAGGTPFADGLLCVQGSVARLGGAISVDGSCAFGALGAHPLWNLGSATPPGSTRWYQGYYRNAAAYCTAAPTNLTNVVRVLWTY